MLTGDTKIPVNFHCWTWTFFFFLECKILSRDLPPSHVALLLSSVIKHVGRRMREEHGWRGGFELLFHHPPLGQNKSEKNEPLPSPAALHHLPFTSQPTAIWLPFHRFIQTAPIQRLQCFPTCGIQWPIFRPLALALSVALDTAGQTRVSRLCAYSNG